MIADKTWCYIFLSKNDANRGRINDSHYRCGKRSSMHTQITIRSWLQDVPVSAVAAVVYLSSHRHRGIGRVGRGEEAVNMLLKAVTKHPLVALLRIADDVEIRLRAAISNEYVSSPHQATANSSIGHGATYDDFPCFNVAVPAGQDRVK